MGRVVSLYTLKILLQLQRKDISVIGGMMDINFIASYKPIYTVQVRVE